MVKDIIKDKRFENKITNNTNRKMGAGILPITIHKGAILFLFGRERYNNQWSDFGGSTEKGETTIDTAIREGGEELNGIYGIGNKLHSRVLNNLVNLLYYDTYSTYIFKVPYDKGLPTYFKNNNEFTEYYLPKHISNKYNGLFEKDEIKWFTLAELSRERSMFRPFYQNIVNILVNDYDNLLYNAKSQTHKVGD